VYRSKGLTDSIELIRYGSLKRKRRMVYVQSFPFTGKVVTLAKSAVGGRGESAVKGGGGFADFGCFAALSGFT